jgi:hypothetical protein
MEPYWMTGKLAKSLMKVNDVNLIGLPLGVMMRGIVRAKTDGAKRCLVQAVRSMEREIMTRGLYKQETQ